MFNHLCLFAFHREEFCDFYTVFTSYITNAGVPHGSVLGSTLFPVFINDFPGEVLSRIVIYANDKVEFPGELELDLVVMWYMVMDGLRHSMPLNGNIFRSIAMRPSFCACGDE